MRAMLVFHIVAGSLGLLSGYVALYAAKGGAVHRRSGMVFVSVMLMMAITGLLISAVEGVAPAINIPTALLVFYLVITGLTTVRPLPVARVFDVALMMAAFLIAFGCVVTALVSIGRGGAEAGMAYPLTLFAGVALAAGVGDRRVLRDGALRGSPRLKRHLWRMCFALSLAAMAFFIGQADVFPRPIRIRPLLALPLLAVLATMFFWMWRLRRRRPAAAHTSPRVQVRVEDALAFNPKEQTS